MKKKIYISFLIFTFLVSTTGLPVTYHFCYILQKKSLDDCNVCMSDSILENYSCCSLENDINDSNIVIVKSENSICCQTEFSFNKVEDYFVTNKTELHNFKTLDELFQTQTITINADFYSNSKTKYNDTSPPFIIAKDLYITNSVLLI